MNLPEQLIANKYIQELQIFEKERKQPDFIMDEEDEEEILELLTNASNAQAWSLYDSYVPSVYAAEYPYHEQHPQAVAYHSYTTGGWSHDVIELPDNVYILGEDTTD